MLTVSICEDEAYTAARLRALAEEYGRARGLALRAQVFDSGEAFLATGRWEGILLMDVKLPGEDGLEIVRRLRDRGGRAPVIFITAYRDYVFGAFDLDAAHYLLKPVSREKLFTALDRAAARLPRAGGRALWVQGGGRLVRVRAEDILYCEALGHQVTVHTAEGQFAFSGTLEALEKELTASFFRCHKSYLVNMDVVVAKEPGAALLAGGARVLVARRRQRQFTRRLLEACRTG